MADNDKWLYFNIHDIVRMRVEAGHASERSVRLVFGPFETDYLDEVDLTLQYNPPQIPEHSFASESYFFTKRHVYIRNYKLHLVKSDDGFILASKRDLLPFVPAVIQTLLLRHQHCLIHSAAIAVRGRGVLLPGWGGTGKTSAIICLLKELAGVSFMGDDYTILASDSKILSFPKAFFIYPYHRGLFPHLFKSRHKPLVPQALSGIIETVRKGVRPTIMAFPKLENFARRFTPEHMQVPAQTALPDVEFVNAAPLESILFIERYSGEKTCIDELDLPEVTRRLLGNWHFEQGRCSRELLLGAAGTGVMDFEQYFSSMSSVINSALAGRKIYRLRMGRITPAETGKAVTEAVRKLLANQVGPD